MIMKGCGRGLRAASGGDLAPASWGRRISDQDLVDTIYKDNKISTRFEDQSVGTLSRRIPKTLQAGDWPVVSPSGREERDRYPARSDEYIFIFGKDADGEELGKQEQRNQRQKERLRPLKVS